ncbi:N-acetylglucosamine-6-phosphate deacetylase [Evansella vedderi]|uniref:N-acetylglucosamine-6-phosphate deacetylase n=1 Tax=Evansella vedderi TaxID=38282 RepID=A0ABT9ZXW9_9BACI|nr:N-acetylglucosamine-6-phosphate deacetylase [Evansella vedderi]MDQ0256084.1 N-acetylglucosamine-6-phosphate deacetylase [Evansella vedderi]
MKKYVFKNATLYSSKGFIKDPVIEIKEGLIANFYPMEKLREKQMIEDYVFTEPVRIVPGFIDLHIHGAANGDVMDGTEEALVTIKNALPSEGTTAFLATTITQSQNAKLEALKQVKEVMTSKNREGAEILGVHLEGPFISEKRAGAQPKEFISEPDVDLFNKFQETAGGAIKLITMAPEEKGGMELLRELSRTGVVPSIGHSDAYYNLVKEAMDLGVCHATHLFNGMRGVHHRDLGVAGAVLLHDEIIGEIICDGIHVSPPMVKLVYKNKGADGIILITDSMRAKGFEEGTYELGGQDVFVKNNQATLEDGTLAGSILKMNEAVRNMISFSGCTFEEAIQMASANPAKQIGVYDRKGSIEIGKDADFVVLNEKLEVKQTFVLGTKVYG